MDTEERITDQVERIALTDLYDQLPTRLAETEAAFDVQASLTELTQWIDSQQPADHVSPTAEPVSHPTDNVDPPARPRPLRSSARELNQNGPLLDSAIDERGKRLGVAELARRGLLADAFGRASVAERRRLRREAYELLHPMVFARLTRRMEARRGHRDCMVSISGLRPDCLDRFHDDMDAVLDDLFHQAHVPIHNLESWVSRRLVRATVDGYRRRRGSRAALQRPRIPRWLARELHHDDRLLGIAIDMLEWVGVDATAGVDDWPIEAWAAQRAAETGDYDAARRAVERDIATVITAMRTNPRWYSDYVERPMGHKRFPLAVAQPDGARPAPDQPPSALDAGAVDDARLTELATIAIDIIVARVDRGEDVRAAVVDVLGTLFGSGTAAEVLDRMPGQDGREHELISALLADSRALDLIVAVVLDLSGQ